MEKVMCIRCGSIGYTASPEQVPCSQCGGQHKVIDHNKRDFKTPKRYRILSLLGMIKG